MTENALKLFHENFDSFKQYCNENQINAVEIAQDFITSFGHQHKKVQNQLGVEYEVLVNYIIDLCAQYAFNSSGVIINKELVFLIIEICFGDNIFKRLIQLLLAYGTHEFWKMVLRQEIHPYNENFFTRNHFGTLVKYRKQFTDGIGLTETQIALYNQNISNIDGLILYNIMQKLYLSMNRISNCDVLRSFKNLTQLSLDSNNLTSIRFVRELYNLQTLLLNKNQIADSDELYYVKKLNYLQDFQCFENPMCQCTDFTKKLVYIAQYNNNNILVCFYSKYQYEQNLIKFVNRIKLKELDMTKQNQKRFEKLLKDYPENTCIRILNIQNGSNPFYRFEKRAYILEMKNQIYAKQKQNAKIREINLQKVKIVQRLSKQMHLLIFTIKDCDE